jgi:hypothetical protein
MEKEEKKGNAEEVKEAGKEVKETPKMRQIIIETDGNTVNLVKAEVSGVIELSGILQRLMEFLNKQQK